MVDPSRLSGGDRERDTKTAEVASHPGSGQKHLRDPIDEQPAQGPAKRANIEPDAPRLRVTGYPQHVPVNQDLLVLPPIPRDLYNELTALTDDPVSDCSTTEPETSEDEIERRKLCLT